MMSDTVAPLTRHRWARIEGGQLDTWAFDGDVHNGPMCAECHRLFCQHCEPDQLAAIHDGTYEERYGGCDAILDVPSRVRGDVPERRELPA